MYSWLLPASSGLLACLSFPKWNQGYLAWVALVPLVVFLVRTPGPGRAFRGGLLAGGIQFLGILIWIPRVLIHYGGLPWPAAWTLFLLLAAMLGCYPALACAATRYAMNRLGPEWLFLFGPAWVTTEYLRNWSPFGGFPWLLTGYSQTDFLPLIQIADISGVWGVSFLVVVANVSWVWIWLCRSRKIVRLIPITAALLGVAACLAYGMAALKKWDRLQPAYHAGLLQGNLSLDEPESALISKYRDGYVAMADQLGGRNPDLLVLPESPAPLLYEYDITYRDTLRSLARRYPLGLVFSNIGFGKVQAERRYFNSAFFLDRTGNEVARYDKIHLVPFGEYIPLKTLFFFTETIAKDVGSFHPGNELVTVPLGKGTANAIICFEAVFPELVREFVLRGSQVIINLTNDGWYGDTAAPYQHLAMARWRAVENRRYLLRAANSGISAIVEPSGRIQVQTGLLRTDRAVGRFAFLADVTPYARYGRSFPALCAIITAWPFLLAAFAAVRRKQRRNTDIGGGNAGRLE